MTEEQHALLLELASLNGGSAAGFLRELLDRVTPLLRTVVPAMRTASQEMDAANAQMQSILQEAHKLGLNTQLDLLDEHSGEGTGTASVSERARARTGGRKAAKRG